MGAAGRRQICKNRVVLAAMAGTLVWFADQPTVAGYNPLLEMFWDPGIWRTPAHDRLVLLLSWLVTTLFCHFLLFAFQKVRHRTGEVRVQPPSTQAKSAWRNTP